MPDARPLDGFERHWWVLGQLAPVAVVFSARFRARVGERDLRAALDVLQRRHALLRARIDPAPRPRFVFDVREPVPVRVGAASYAAEAEEEANHRYGPGPLARVALLPGEASEVLLGFHHALADATAAHALLGELAQLLGPRAAEARARLAQPLPSPEALRAYLPEGAGRAGFGERLRVAREVLRARKQGPALLPEDAPGPAGRTRVLPRVVEPDALAALAARAKQEGTTVHGALCAAAMLAVRAEVPREGALLLPVSSPVDVRGVLAHAPPDPFGFYAAVAPTYPRVAPDAPFWEVARDVRRRVQGMVEQRAMLPLRAMFDSSVPQRADRAQAYAQRLERFSTIHLGVTNVGRLDAPDLPGALPAEALRFVPPTALGGPRVFLAAATSRGALHANFTWRDPVVGEARAPRIADRAMELLAKAA
jgi:NRPS condensation-like uncharacterized protein